MEVRDAGEILAVAALSSLAATRYHADKRKPFGPLTAS